MVVILCSTFEEECALVVFQIVGHEVRYFGHRLLGPLLVNLLDMFHQSSLGVPL
jgi:hypothetical protein